MCKVFCCMVRRHIPQISLIKKPSLFLYKQKNKKLKAGKKKLRLTILQEIMEVKLSKEYIVSLCKYIDINYVKWTISFCIIRS